MENEMIFVRIATINDLKYIPEILCETEVSAIARGTGIAKRNPEAVGTKIAEGKAVIAVTLTGEWVGFSYLQDWENGRFVSNSGLIVHPRYRKTGIATVIKERVFKMSRRLYPNAKIFSITSGTAVMKLNFRLGFAPVAFSEITRDEAFWDGCKGCINHDVLQRKGNQNCLCTAMLFDPIEMEREQVRELQKRSTPFVHH